MGWDGEDDAWSGDAGPDYSTYIDEAEADEDVVDVSFTVTNPAGTISATLALGGVTREVELSPSVCSMTESQLGDEILQVAALAAQKAHAAQYAVVKEMMCLLGHDSTAVDGLLQHTTGWPTPETVAERSAKIFSASYSENDG